MNFHIKLWNWWIRQCSKVNIFFEKLFMKWTSIVASQPWKIVLCGLVISLSFMAGFARFKEQKHTEKLFFPGHSRSKDDLNRAQKSFPQKARPDEIVITMADGVSNILHSTPLLYALDIHNKIAAHPGFQQNCIKVAGKCFLLSPLEIFHYNQSELADDENIQRVLLNSINNKRLLMANGRTPDVALKDALGNLKVDNKSSTIYSSAIKFMYFMVFPEDEKEYKPLNEFQGDIIDMLLIDRERAIQQGLRLYVRYSRSFDDEISASSGGDVSLVVISIGLMFGFAVIVLMSMKHRIKGHSILGVVGVLCCIFGIGSGFGLVMLSGNYFIGFVGTLPFLVLGVGIDDMFIIISALDKLPSDVTGKERVKKTMGKIGASITMTTLTDIVAFAVSSSSDFEGVRVFCFYAMTAILFTFLLITSVFVAVMALDVKRIESGGWDMLICINKGIANPWHKTSSNMSTWIMEHWAKFLSKNPVRFIVVLVSFGLLSSGIYATFRLKVNFETNSIVSDGSYIVDFEKVFPKHFSSGFHHDIVVDDPNFDYTDSTNQKEYMKLETICEENAYFTNNVINWMGAFLDFNESDQSNTSFYEKLGPFLMENPGYRGDLRIHPTTKKILYSRIRCTERNVNDWKFRADAMLKIRDDIEQKSKISKVFPITLDYFFRDMIVFVVSETSKNMALSAAAILLITTPYLVHPMVILMVFGGFVALVFELFGLMVIWNVPLNSISMISSIMAIGFSVDYSAHIAHFYLKSNGDTPEKRMIQAMKSVGSSVFMGGFTTFLGIVVLAFGKSEVFRTFFKMFFGIVVLGLLNGLVFIPVFLTLLVRNKVNLQKTDEPAETKVVSVTKHREGEHTHQKTDGWGVVITNTNHWSDNHIQRTESETKLPSVLKNETTMIENAHIVIVNEKINHQRISIVPET